MPHGTLQSTDSKRQKLLAPTRFITRVRSPLSSSSGVGGRGLFGAPLDEGPGGKESIFDTHKKFK